MAFGDTPTLREHLLSLVEDEAGYTDIDDRPIGMATDVRLLLLLVEDLYGKLESAESHSHSIT